MTLCLPSHILDTLFGCSKRQQVPASHLLVSININNHHPSEGWTPLPFALTVQTAARDWRRADGDENNGSVVVDNSFVDFTALLPAADNGAVCGDGGVQSVLKNIVFAPEQQQQQQRNEKIAFPPSAMLGPALVQSFLDLPVAVDVLLKRPKEEGEEYWSTRIQLEQCVFVKSGAESAFSVSVDPGDSAVKARLRFALPSFIVQQLQQQQQPPVKTPMLSTVTVRPRSSIKKQSHDPDAGRILQTEHLLHSLCVVSGGQGSMFAVPTNDNEKEKEGEEGNLKRTFFVLYEVMQSAPTAVGIIGPETKIVVNTSSSSSPIQQRIGVHVDPAASSSDASSPCSFRYCDYNGEFGRIEQLFLASSPASVRGLLVSGRRGMGKSEFVQALAAKVFPDASERKKMVHVLDAAALAAAAADHGAESSMMASHVVAKMQRICSATLLVERAGVSSKKPWLLIDPATEFFSSEFGDDDGGDGTSSPASKFLSAISSPAHSSSLLDQVVLVCVLPQSKSHLVSDSFRRRVFSGDCGSVELQLPSQEQRSKLLKHFAAVTDDESSAAAALLALAQRTSGGYSNSDLKKIATTLVSRSSSRNGAIPHLQQLPRPQLELEEASSFSGHKKKSLQQQQSEKQQSGGTAENINGMAKKTSWSDIAGLDAVKKQIHRAILWPIQNPARAKLFGMERLSGVMLHGPPGNAKTTIARAICCEGGFSAFFHLDCATVLSAFVGEAERFIRNTFAQARAQAPSVIFFDEIESFGSKRKKATGSGGGDSDVGVRLLATLLTEMDGVGSGDADDKSSSAASFGVCVIGATNLLHLVDDALLRPGRFDLLLQVPQPGPSDREAIFRHCVDKSNKASHASVSDSESSTNQRLHISADVSTLAAMSRDFSGAEITGVWRDGVVAAVLEGQKKKLLLLAGEEEEEEEGDDAECDEVIELDVTKQVAAHIRSLAKKK